MEGNLLGVLILNIITLIINIIIVILISIRFGKLDALKDEYMNLKNDFDELLYENSYLSTQYLNSFEEKISEGEKLLETLMEKENIIKKDKSPEKDDDNGKYNPVTMDIAKMLKQGKSITEIAEKLNSTKGEVILRLNLGEKIIEKG